MDSKPDLGRFDSYPSCCKWGHARIVTNVTLKMSDLSVLRFDILTKVRYIGNQERKENKVFYYEVKFANGESLVILADGDPVDQIPVEFQGDVVNVETVCEVAV